MFKGTKIIMERMGDIFFFGLGTAKRICQGNVQGNKSRKGRGKLVKTDHYTV